MKPAKFDYFAPTSVAEVLELLRHHGSDAKLLAGGQSLMPVLNFRLNQPAVIVDINRVSELAYIRDEETHLAIGALTRQRQIENSDDVARRAPLLAAATDFIGHPPIRSRGTIGGSLVNADPAAEDPAVAIALDFTMLLKSHRGDRRVGAADFFLGVLETVLDEDEMLVGIEVPALPPASGCSFQEISRRHGDFALAGVAAQITLDGGRVTDARLAACGVGPGPVRLSGAEDILERDGISDTAIAEAASMAASEVSPFTDVHASAEYRRKLTRTMTGRALRQAAERARGGAPGVGPR